MARSIKRIGVVLVFVAGAAQAGDDLYNWRCPYNTDGGCPPRRQTYGHFGTKWSRWPGVTNADYETKIKPGELAGPPVPEDIPPRETPLEMLLPPDPTKDRRDDGAPMPPGDDGAGPPALTPDAAPRPDILSPPGEDIMEELLPEDEPTQPRTPPDAAPELMPEFTEEPTPEGDTDFEISPDEDPFKDDPLFQDDAAPAPPDSSDGGPFERRFETPRGDRAPGMPALHRAPTRLPTAQSNPIRPEFSEDAQWSQSEAEPGPRLMPASRPALRSSAGRTVVRGALAQRTRGHDNPLRAASAADLLAVDGEVLPTAAWQQPEPVKFEPEPQTPLRNNPLRQ